MLITEAQWRANHSLGVRVKDIIVKFEEFDWTYCGGIILTEKEIETLHWRTIGNIIAFKRKNAIRGLVHLYNDDIGLIADMEEDDDSQN